MDSITPLSDGEDMQHGEKVSAEFFESGCQSSHVLHFAEEPLNNIAHGIEICVMRDRVSGV